MSNSSGRKRIGRPPGADADRTRAAILDAALEAFAERGYEGASIREITSAAGVGHNLVRHYFGAKDDLWRAAVHHGLDPAAAQIAGLLRSGADDSTEHAVRASLAVLLDEVENNPTAVRLLVAEALRGGPRFDAMFDEIIGPLGEVLVESTAGVTDALADVDIRVLGIFVFGAVFGASSFDGLVHRLGLSGRPHQQLADELLELVLYGVLGRR